MPAQAANRRAIVDRAPQSVSVYAGGRALVLADFGARGKGAVSAPDLIGVGVGGDVRCGVASSRVSDGGVASSVRGSIAQWPDDHPRKGAEVVAHFTDTTDAARPVGGLEAKAGVVGRRRLGNVRVVLRLGRLVDRCAGATEATQTGIPEASYRDAVRVDRARSVVARRLDEPGPCVWLADLVIAARHPRFAIAAAADHRASTTPGRASRAGGAEGRVAPGVGARHRAIRATLASGGAAAPHGNREQRSHADEVECEREGTCHDLATACGVCPRVSCFGPHVDCSRVGFGRAAQCAVRASVDVDGRSDGAVVRGLAEGPSRALSATNGDDDAAGERHRRAVGLECLLDVTAGRTCVRGEAAPSLANPRAVAGGVLIGVCVCLPVTRRAAASGRHEQGGTHHDGNRYAPHGSTVALAIGLTYLASGAPPRIARSS